MGLPGAAKEGFEKSNSLSEAKKQFNDFKQKANEEFGKLSEAGSTLVDVIQNAFQSPDPTDSTGQCVFDSSPRCVALKYRFGFNWLQALHSVAPLAGHFRHSQQRQRQDADRFAGLLPLRSGSAGDGLQVRREYG